MKYLLGLAIVFFFTTTAQARITFEPYYSVSSTKNIQPNRAKGTETETIEQREEKGLRAGIGLWRWFGLNLEVGQGFGVKTSTTGTIKDNYGQIDFNEELNSSTEAPGKELKVKDTQNNGRVNLLFDPSFWIFIFRFKAGVTAQQRITTLFNDGVEVKRTEPPITYKPNASLGVGVRIGPRMFFMIEYGVYFYSFPKPEPFERQASVSYGFAI